MVRPRNSRSRRIRRCIRYRSARLPRQRAVDVCVSRRRAVHVSSRVNCDGFFAARWFAAKKFARAPIFSQEGEKDEKADNKKGHQPAEVALPIRGQRGG